MPEWEDKIKYKEFKEEHKWVALLAHQQEAIAPDLMDAIHNGNAYTAVLAAVILRDATHKKRKKLPFSIIVEPLLEIHNEGISIAKKNENRGISPDRWPKPDQKWRCDGKKYQVMPRGDLYEWVSSYLVEHGNILEPLLRERIEKKTRKKINPAAEFYVMMDFPVFHKQLSEETHAVLANLVNDIALNYDFYKNWYDADPILAVYEYSKFPYGKPEHWEKFLKVTGKDFP